MTSQWVMTLLGMPHCGTTMGNDIARDVHYDITMDNDVAMNLLCYVLLTMPNYDIAVSPVHSLKLYT